MSHRTGGAGPPTEALPPGMSAWICIEECVGETLDALRALGDGATQSLVFLSFIHMRVKLWLSFEVWACLLEPGHYTPDELLTALQDQGVDPSQLPRQGHATPPQTGQAPEWRAFDRGASGA